MDKVHQQYEAYPYPRRDPRDEVERLLVMSPSHLPEVIHHVYGGRRPGRRLRVLVAGGGTGDSTIAIATQLAADGIGGEVTYLDMSTASRAICEERARIRGLGNLRFVTGRIEDVPSLCPGPYDYIDCCGVLHHLESPERGLGALVEVLAPDGGLGLMVYGETGRTGVYHVQELLRRLTPKETLPGKVEAARRLLADLPETNLFRRNTLVKADLADDAGLVDLLLHPRDVAYRVPDVHRLAASAGLRVASFMPGWLYEPRFVLKDPALLAQAMALPPEEQAAVAELVTCALHKHSFYAVRRQNPVVTRLTAADRDAVLIPFFDQVLQEIRSAPPGTPVSHRDRGGLSLTFSLSPPLARAAGLIDGQRSLARIHAEAGAELGSWENFFAAFHPLYELLVAVGAVHLKHVGPVADRGQAS